MYHFTGIQHTKTGEVTIPTLDFDTLETALNKFHEEWVYTYASEDRMGLDTIIFDDQGKVVFTDKYVKGAVNQNV